MDRVSLANRISQLRIEKGLSQNQLAQQLGVKRSVVSYYESGDRLPSLDVLIEMSRVFSVSTDYLLKGKDASRIISVSDLNERDIDIIIAMVNALRERRPATSE